MDGPPESLDNMSPFVTMRPGGLTALIQSMEHTGFHTWGFVIYRGTYGDDAVWERYMVYFKNAITLMLKQLDEDRLLPQYSKWTVIEDPALQDRPKAVVRERFQQWVSEASESRDGPGHDKLAGRTVARFSHCVYVDERCLRTFRTWEEFKQTHEDYDPANPFYPNVPQVVCVLISKDWEPPGSGASGQPDVEGCDRFYVGWTFTTPSALPEAYNALCSQMTNLKSWYCRPPLLYPSAAYEKIVPP